MNNIEKMIRFIKHQLIHRPLLIGLITVVIIGKRFVKGVLPNIIWEYKIAAHRTHSYEQRFCVMLWMELFNKTLLASFKNGSHTDKTQTLLYDLRFSYCIFSSFFVASPDAHKIRSYSWYL